MENKLKDKTHEELERKAKFLIIGGVVVALVFIGTVYFFGEMLFEKTGKFRGLRYLFYVLVALFVYFSQQFRVVRKEQKRKE